MVTELEKMKRAKLYLDELSKGGDPITGRKVPEDSVLQNDRLARCFAYVSGVLEQVIRNGGVVRRSSASDENKLPFLLEQEKRGRIEYSEEPVSITRFAERINMLIDQNVMQRVKITAFTKWLMEQGYLQEETAETGQKRKMPTDKGNQIGMTAKLQENARGAYMIVLYDENAQHFLADHLDEVVESYQKNSGKSGDSSDGEPQN